MVPLQVGIALRHGLVRQGLEWHLARHPGYAPVDALQSGCQVDVWVTDELWMAVRSAAAPAPRVMCADLSARTEVLRALAHGAHACVSIHSSFQDLDTAIESARQGRRFLCPMLAEMMGARSCILARTDLTPRESDVMRWIAAGYSSKQIGRKLQLSPHTVDTHRRNIMQKLGLHKSTELTRHAVNLERLGQSLQSSKCGQLP
jgi:DNA-binding NarL/FixJ family response regulator